MEAEVRSVIEAAVVPSPTDEQRAQALQRLQSMRPSFQRAFPVGWSQTDEDLADGHLEGAWENGLVSDDERQLWAGRLARFEVWPEDVEAFLTTRIRGA